MKKSSSQWKKEKTTREGYLSFKGGDLEFDHIISTYISLPKQNVRLHLMKAEDITFTWTVRWVLLSMI